MIIIFSVHVQHRDTHRNVECMVVGGRNTDNVHRICYFSKTTYNIIPCGHALSYQRVGRLYVGMTRTCLCRYTYESFSATAPTLHLLAVLGT